MRKALVVGIDYYNRFPALHGCVHDASSVKSTLDRNGDSSLNFTARLMVSSSPADAISRAELKRSIIDLFQGASETALLYFAGHGYVEAAGGYILASDSRGGDEGIPLGEVLAYANSSQAANRIIILDSCHSGIAGTRPAAANYAEVSDGLTILAASTAEQYANEEDGGGVFTTLLVDALNGAAANLVGEVTPGSVYAHIDQSLGPWEQRPVFKANVKSFVSLRRAQAPLQLAELQRIVELFPSPGFQFRLDPSFEPESGQSNPANCEKFALLQKYNRVNLVVPEEAPHMYHAAMGSKSCRLTVLGEHYRRLVERARI
jgi:Caspase domain